MPFFEVVDCTFRPVLSTFQDSSFMRAPKALRRGFFADERRSWAGCSGRLDALRLPRRRLFRLLNLRLRCRLFAPAPFAPCAYGRAGRAALQFRRGASCPQACRVVPASWPRRGRDAAPTSRSAQLGNNAATTLDLWRNPVRTAQIDRQTAHKAASQHLRARQKAKRSSP